MINVDVHQSPPYDALLDVYVCTHCTSTCYHYYERFKEYFHYGCDIATYR